MLSSHLRLGLPNGLFPSGFPHQKLVHTSPFLYACHMPRPSHSSRFYHPHWRILPKLFWLVLTFGFIIAVTRDMRHVLGSEAISLVRNLPKFRWNMLPLSSGKNKTISLPPRTFANRSIYGATVPSEPWFPLIRRLHSSRNLLVSLTSAFLGSVMCPSWRHPIMFLVFPLLSEQEY